MLGNLQSMSNMTTEGIQDGPVEISDHKSPDTLHDNQVINN